MQTTRLRITVPDVEPRVVRVIDVPAAVTLAELHQLLQVALGWTDSHLHLLVADGVRYGVPDPDGDDALQPRDEATALLGEMPVRFEYLYDFGDSWEHEVEVVGAGGEGPGCVEGEGACPPEDCGGVPGYEHLLEVLADPSHVEYEHLREWAGELPAFDREATDLLIRQTVGEVPESVRIVLDLLAGGVKLTPGGRLPRAVVRAVQEQRPDWYPLERPASIEEDLPPLAVLHDILRKVGLARLARGVLRPTRAAGDDVEVVRRLRRWFEPGGYEEMLATTTVAVLAASGPLAREDLLRRVVPLMGVGWGVDGRASTDEEHELSLNWMSAELGALDLLAGGWHTWEAGPSARTLLPRATALAPLPAGRPPW
ncbi:plasmid pRiA4b ORF-3 family protein [Pseudonocardia kujensis]|uniref:plasmid pRiA4b ORF-3 family protein n=1 Tax=Pseudonocardia kujensis TaxID=1128675 RepID=UPI001E39BC3C|nr:plasmid pRiA4b ORF-3 family protein [Pseudonocardia kujensis]MCE0764895.1 plasmid pRiA4b ORF-3 family protein [Pseudonocardia kujensis]